MKIRTIAILIATLIIGMVLGSLGTGYFVRKKVKNISKRMRNPDHFKEFMMDRMNLSAEQQTAIEPIMDEHFKTRRALRKKHFQDLIENEQKFHKALEPHLEDEQMVFLKRKLERMKRRFWRKKRFKHRRRRRHHRED
ncbi:MAG TPA: hypothetical protein DCS93_15520 [Microscillaceae bacterium]|nr:hypothetical protein [Microscillaceae bacterium]